MTRRWSLVIITSNVPSHQNHVALLVEYMSAKGDSQVAAHLSALKKFSRRLMSKLLTALKKMRWAVRERASGWENAALHESGERDIDLRGLGFELHRVWQEKNMTV